MESDTENGDNETNVEENPPEETQKKKKMRKFDAKEFRQALLSKEYSEAIVNFVQLCSDDPSEQDCALEYLEIGGNCTEICRLIELIPHKTSAYLLPIFEALRFILLKIAAVFPDKSRSAADSALELLKKYGQNVKNMLSLNSSGNERQVALKLLTSMVTLSPRVASEILAKIVFNEALLKVLLSQSKKTSLGNSESTRISLIHFIISFLIDGNPRTIMALLHKKALLGSIFFHLQFDPPEVVNLVFSTVRQNVLENRDVTKSAKMCTFNTQVVRVIFKLCEEKKPRAKRKFWSEKRRVNEADRVKIAEYAHEFLSVLCASRHGLIFRDPTLGLGAEHRNLLIWEALKYLEAPWNNPLISDLVIKICQVCPDLFDFALKTVLPVLEPRLSPQWISAVQFLRLLIQNVDQEKMGPFLAGMNLKKVHQVAQKFIVPCGILQFVAGFIKHENLRVRHEGILLLDAMLAALEKFFGVVNGLNSFQPRDKDAFRAQIDEYLNKNLPESSLILNVWKKCMMPHNSIEKSATHTVGNLSNSAEKDKNSAESIPEPTLSVHLNALLNVLHKYNTVVPNLKEIVVLDMGMEDFLVNVKKICAERDENFVNLQINTIHSLLLYNPTIFTPSRPLFSSTMNELLHLYCANVNSTQKLLEIEILLSKLLRLSGIFEGCTGEILVWLYSLLAQNCPSSEIPSFLTRCIVKTCTRFLVYTSDITSLISSGDIVANFDEIINSLDTESLILPKREYFTETTLLSPLILGLLDTLLEKNTQDILTFAHTVLVHLLHSQTSPSLLTSIVLRQQYENILPMPVIKYYTFWPDTKIEPLKNIESLHCVYKAAKFLMKNDIDNSDDNLKFFDSCNWHNSQSVLVVKLATFYFTQLHLKKTLTAVQEEKCFSCIKYTLNKKCADDYIFTNCLDEIFNNSVLVQNFFTRGNYRCTKFILNIIQELSECPKLDKYLKTYQEKFINYFRAKKIISVSFISDAVKLLRLTHEQYSEILLLLSRLSVKALIAENNPSPILHLITFALNAAGKKQPYPDEILKKLVTALAYLYEYKHDCNFDDFTTSICGYMEKYPHVSEYFDKKKFSVFLKNPAAKTNTVSLLKLLIKYNSGFQKFFCNSVLHNAVNILEKRELVFTVLNQVLNVKFPALNNVYKKLYEEHEQFILKVLNKPQKAPNYFVKNYKVVDYLINKYMSVETCKTFGLKVMKFDVTEPFHAAILNSVYMKTAEVDSDRIQIVSNYISTFMHLLVYSLKRVEKFEDEWPKIQEITNLFSVSVVKLRNKYLNSTFDISRVFSSAIFDLFGKFCLKLGLSGRPFLLEILTQLCKFSPKPVENIANLFHLAISHSETLNILLSENELKRDLLELFWVLCKKCPEVMAKSHIPVFLGAYSATLSDSDQFLVQILGLYDQHEVGLYRYKPYLWGEAAVEYYSVRGEVENNLLRHPKPIDVLNLFSIGKIQRTLTHFPVYRSVGKEENFKHSVKDIYDPAFYLPLLSHLLAPESTIYWSQVVNTGALSLVIVALGSKMPEVRLAAYHVLARSHFFIEADRTRKYKLFWQHVIETICRGITQLEDLKLPPIVALFLARSTMVLTKYDHELFATISDYFIAKPYLDFSIVPELLEMLHNTSVNYLNHRNFMLELLRDGVKTSRDLQVLHRSFALKLLMDRFNSVLISAEGRVLILQVLSAAVNIPFGAESLCSHYSLFSWLHSSVLPLITPSDPDLLTALIEFTDNFVKNYGDDSCFEEVRFSLLTLLREILRAVKGVKVKKEAMGKFVKNFYKVFVSGATKGEVTEGTVTEEELRELLEVSSAVFECWECFYWVKYPKLRFDHPAMKEGEEEGECYLKLLTVKWIEVHNKNLKVV